MKLSSAPRCQTNGLPGTLTGTDSFIVSGTFHWDGAVSGSGSLDANGGIELVSGTLNGRTLNNSGTATMTGSLSVANGATINNRAGATFDIQTDADVLHTGSVCPVFTNAGLFLKSGGTGVTDLQMQLYNSGTVRIDSGTLNVDCGYVQVTGGASGTISGSFTGEVSIANPGQLNLVPNPTPPPPVTTYTQTATGSLFEQIGGLTPGTGYGQIIVIGDVNLAGSLQVQLINGFTPQLNDQFTIIDNRGSNSVSGTFTGLPEGATLLAGTYGFTISYMGGAGNDVVLTTTVVNHPPTATAGGPYTIAEGGSLSLNGSGSSDPDPLDTLTYSWDVNGDGTFGDASGVSPTLTWSQLQALGINDGPRTVPNVRVRVDDGHGHVVDSPVTTLTVNNVAPTATLSGSPSTAIVGQTITPSLSSPLDPSSTDVAAGLRYVFTIDAALPAANYATSSTTASASFTITTAGVHTIYARIIDKDGGHSDYTATVNVNYLSSGFLSPISLNRAFKQGSTIPIKWQLTDASGHLISSLSAITSLTVSGPTSATLYPGNNSSSGLPFFGTTARSTSTTGRRKTSASGSTPSRPRSTMAAIPS